MTETRTGLIPSAAGIVMAMVPLWHRWLTDTVGATASFRWGTVVMLGALCCLIHFWPAWERMSAGGAARVSPSGRAFGLAVVLVLAGVVALTLLPVLFAGRLDPKFGDMLVVVDAGIREFLAGRMPYRIYQLPGDVPLPYGPALWGPYVGAVALQIDLRVVSLVAMLTALGAGLMIGIDGLFARRWRPAVAVIVPALLLAGHADIRAFFPIAHTLVYWPLLVLFAFLVAKRRWMWAAAVLGALISARSTMVSLVPVLLMASHVAGVSVWRPMLVIGVCACGPLVPFLVQDPGAIVYAFVGSYEKVMKGFVWTQTNWAHHTYGLTSVLLQHDLGRFAQIAQALSLIAVNGLAWTRLRDKQAPEPWLIASFMVFTMTSLWPVLYTYFDVWILMLGCLAAAVFKSSRPGDHAVRRPMALLATTGVVSLAGVLAVGAYQPGARYTIDIGTAESAGFTGGGFGSDVAVVEGGRTLVWVTGTHARVRLPRAGWGAATIELHLRPVADRQPPPLLVATLNGEHIGGATLRDGWQVVSLQTRSRDWLYGFNVLDVSLDYAAAGPTEHEQSIALDKVVLR